VDVAFRRRLYCHSTETPEAPSQQTGAKLLDKADFSIFGINFRAVTTLSALPRMDQGAAHQRRIQSAEKRSQSQWPIALNSEPLLI
jgi:hypothetical protein